MLKRIDHRKMGKSDLGWLQSLFHFSFADYHNPQNMNFGVLRVLNDDLVAPGTGFDMHPHRDMEIISYVVEGSLSHKDSLGNQGTLTRGQVQYMSAGTGVLHSEHNRGKETARLLQVWILPYRKGHQPSYGDYPFPWEGRVGRLLHFASGPGGSAPVKVNQDVNFYALALEAGKEISFPLPQGRQAYVVQIEGDSRIGEAELSPRDALEAIEEDLTVQAKTDSHLLFIEMGKS
ncbi:pirin family protein [Anaerotalea alkaliphila]|uniref:Pirin family protein n=1 Tax=Anaerotalea alkaliphila TaxID=2662126 RepID=A0A7X5HU10_9FIRM|nr:pirin family protein [Anaerotalea alkaliphila]NDL66653.1 pirin family protein [Anaerotalea alkaliphila]